MTSTDPYALLAETARQRDEARRQVAVLEAALTHTRLQHAETRIQMSDLEAELVGVRSQLDAVRALAEREVDNQAGCDCAGPPDLGGGVYGSHEGDCAANDLPLIDARDVLAALGEG